MSVGTCFDVSKCEHTEEVIPVLFQICVGQNVTLTLPYTQAVHRDLFQLRVWQGEYRDSLRGFFQGGGHVGSSDDGHGLFEVMSRSREDLVRGIVEIVKGKKHEIVDSANGREKMDVWF